MNDPVVHDAPMTLGLDGQYGHGETTTTCGIFIPDKTVTGAILRHSNLIMHVTCVDCLRATVFSPPDRSDPVALEKWLAL